MRNYTSAIVTFIIMAGMVAGCDLFSGNNDSGPVTLTGLVINSVSNDPVQGAFVRILPQDVLGETDDQGRYSVVVDVDSTMNVDITVSTSGYVNQSTSILAVADRTIEVATIRLVPLEGGTDPTNPGGRVSGPASNLLLLSQSSSSIGVREAGSQEVAELVFQAADSLGRPVTLDNQITVNFSFDVSPGGGAFIAPESAQTNENGEVRTNISAGTVAGVMQILATAQVGNNTIRSKPVSLAVHGGLPHIDHFGVGPAQFNIARAWDVFGIAADITAHAGDQYFNPVRPGTVIYFTASAGIIAGSNGTAEDGFTSVVLKSANPRPVHPEYGNGYVIVTASTGDINGNEITADNLVLFSGATNIVVPSGQGPIVKGNPYEFHVYDVNLNPLAAGTNITVTASGVNVEAIGNTNTVLKDLLFGDHESFSPPTSFGSTRFTFGYTQGDQQDQNGDPIPDEIEAITIRVNSPNGAAERIIFVNGDVFKRDPNSGALVRDYAGDGVAFNR